MPGKPTILVVEDDENLMLGIKDILELQDYRVLTAINGIDALKVMQARHLAPDLIISDIMMPQMNGYEFFDAVRSDPQWAAIPFVFLTARGEKADVRYGKSIGADEYIIKPFNTEDLLVIVDAKLRRYKELEILRSREIDGIKHNIVTVLNHEFRTPLTYIVAYADLLKQDTSQLDYKEMNSFLHAMNNGAERIRKLIENFILLVELETGEAATIFEYRKQSIENIEEIIKRAVSYVENAATEKHIILKIERADELPSIIGDPEYLRVALSSLLSNGIKFSDSPGSVVTLAAYTDSNGNLQLSVTDTGRGIPEAEREKIFEVFYQINRMLYEDQGVGIGLPIVKHIVDLHGGQLLMETEEGHGSSFTILLPTVN